LAEAAGQHWRVFYLGGRPGVARALGTRFRAMLPELMFRERHGYFDATAESAENRGVVAQIQAFEPHILLVGMGMPRQEAWVMANLAHLPPCVVQPCGAVADYFAGVIPTPPRILARVGLEGVCRLFHEPRRLWRRYLLEPLALVPAFVADVAGQTRPSGRNDQPSSA
jgi:N-acetylglucosaminyldiphosphoundecaprenol N-acetyl-beta-D-mannosaminyltransferase